MTIGDLDRLTYLSAYLGFEEYSLEIWAEFAPQFKEEFLCLQAFQMDRSAWLREGYTESEKKLHALWLKEFRKSSRQDSESNELDLKDECCACAMIGYNGQ